MKNSQKFWKIGMATALATGSIVTVAPGMTAAATSFPDVQKGSTPYEAVMNLTERGIIDGFEDGTYRPGSNVTRGQAAKLIVHALGIDTANVADPGFKDIPKSHRFYKEIAAMANAGYISGYKDGNFGSDDPLTRSQMLRILGESYEFGQAPLETNQFTDVDKDAYYAAYLQPLIDKGVTYGKTETSFAPHQYVDRGQMALFIYRADRVKNDSPSELIETGITKVADGIVHTSKGNYEVSEELKEFFEDVNAGVLKNASISFYEENGKITLLDKVQLNTSGTSTNPLVLNGGGYGIDTLIVQADNLKVENLETWQLRIGNRVQYSFEANNLKVLGGGGVHIEDDEVASISAVSKKASIVFNDSEIDFTTVLSKKGAHVSFKGNTTAKGIMVFEDARIDIAEKSDIGGISIWDDVQEFELQGDVEELVIMSQEESPKMKTLNLNGKIENLIFEGEVEVSLRGDFKIGNIEVSEHFENVTVKDLLKNYDDVKGNLEKIDGEKNPDYKEPTPPSTGGGGGGGGGSSSGGGGNNGSSTTDIDRINSSSTYNGSLTLNTTGTGITNYGPKSGTKTVKGNVTIKGSTTGIIHLSNLTIEGKLIVDTPNGDVVVDPTVKVIGTTEIKDVRASTFINEGTLASVLITDPNGVSFVNNGTAGVITLNTAGKVTLGGKIDSVEVKQNATITVNQGTEIESLNATAEGITLYAPEGAVKKLTGEKVDEIEIPKAPEVKADDKANVLVGANATMECSTDGGKTWTQYNEADVPTFDGDQTVLVRVAADGDVPAGAITEVVFTGDVEEPLPEVNPAVAVETVGFILESQTTTSASGNLTVETSGDTIKITATSEDSATFTLLSEDGKKAVRLNVVVKRDGESLKFLDIGQTIVTFVGTESELENALASGDSEIVFTDDITVTNPVKPTEGVTIDGDGHTLKLDARSPSTNNTAEGLYIAKGVKEVTIKNLTVTRSEGSKNTDNLIEIYGDKTNLENVEVVGGAKAGIYVNNDGQGDLTVNFKSIKTSGNGWDAGVGLAAQQEGSKVIANFEGENSFGENVAVYHEGTTYSGTYELTGLDGFAEVTVGEQQKWIENVPTVSVDLPEGGFEVGVPTEFTITTTANSLAGVNVIGNSTHEFAEAIDSLEYKERDGKWYELTGDFGPVDGFPLDDATSEFRVTFNKAGTYGFKTDIREAANKANVLASVDASFKVKESENGESAEDLAAKFLKDISKEDAVVTLTSDITIENKNVKPAKGVTIDGQGRYTLHIANGDEDNSGGNTAEGLYVANDDITIKGLTVTGTHGDNLIEIYGNNAYFESVTVKDGKKAGIYVNNDGQGNLTVNFKNIKTSGNGWEAGVGLAAQQANSKVIANFEGENSFGENVAVYHEGTTYLGTYLLTGTGLDEFTEVKVGKQHKWIENVPTVSVDLPEEGFEVGEATEFTITTTANNLAGVNVIGNSSHDFADAISKLEYKEQDGKWHEFKGDFGPTEGFSLADVTSEFRVTFNKAGTYEFTTDIREATNKENVFASVNASFEVKGSENEESAEELAAKFLDDISKEDATVTLTSDITVENKNVKPAKGVTIDGQGNTLHIANGDVSNSGGNTAEGLYIANDDIKIKNLTVTGTHGDNLIEIYGNKAHLENVTVKDGEKAGIYVNNNGRNPLTVTFENIKTTGNGWDAGVGLSAQQANSEVIANFKGENSFEESVAVYHEGTTYSGTYQIDGLNEFEKVTVGKQTKWIKNKPTVSVDLPEEGFEVGVPTEFTITTTANNLAGVNVIGNSSHDFADAISKLEYKEQDGKWYEFKGDFGPTEGFPLADVTSEFRVTFNKAGTYEFTTDIREAANKGNILASSEKVSFKVKESSAER